MLCSIRLFSVAGVLCICVVLPLNYFGQPVHHKKLRAESLEVFTIGNIEEGSNWYDSYLHLIVTSVVELFTFLKSLLILAYARQ